VLGGILTLRADTASESGIKVYDNKEEKCMVAGDELCAMKELISKFDDLSATVTDLIDTVTTINTTVTELTSAPPGPKHCQTNICDEEGWILVARHAKNGAWGRSTGGFGSLTSPTQGSSARLSDAAIQELQGDGVATFRWSSDPGSSTYPNMNIYFQEGQKKYKSDVAGSSTFNRCSKSPEGPWHNVPEYYAHYGLHTWQQDSNCGAYVIFIYYDQPYGFTGGSTLWVKPE